MWLNDPCLKTRLVVLVRVIFSLRCHVNYSPLLDRIREEPLGREHGHPKHHVLEMRQWCATLLYLLCCELKCSTCILTSTLPHHQIYVLKCTRARVLIRLHPVLVICITHLILAVTLALLAIVSILVAVPTPALALLRLERHPHSTTTDRGPVPWHDERNHRDLQVLTMKSNLRAFPRKLRARMMLPTGGTLGRCLPLSVLHG